MDSDSFDDALLISIRKRIVQATGWDQPVDEQLVDVVAYLILSLIVNRERVGGKLFDKVATELKAASIAARQAYRSLMAVPKEYREGFDTEGGLLSSVESMEGLAERASDWAAVQYKRKNGRPRNLDFRLTVELWAIMYLRREHRWPTVSFNSVTGKYGGHFIEATLRHLSSLEIIDGPVADQSRAREVARIIRELSAH